MTISSWLTDYMYTCPDPGIVAYKRLDGIDRVGPRIAIWIGVLLAFEQCTHAIALFLTMRRKINFCIAITPKFKMPIGVALAWVIFTALSIDLVALTYRSNAAVLAKTLHVASEVTFLVMLSSSFGFHVFSSICVFAVLTILLMVITMPCSDTITLAAFSGLVLDSINFLAYAWYGLTHPKNPVLWTLIGGLGWHAAYLLTYVGVMRWKSISDLSRVWIRVAGLAFNNIANELLLTASKKSLGLTQSGLVTIEDWKNSFLPLDRPLCLWTSDGLRLIGPVPDDDTPRSIPQFEPHRTGYTRGNLYKALFCLAPFSSSVQYARRGHVTRLRSSILCAFCRQYTISDIEYVSETSVFVLSWNHVRYTSWVFLVVLGVIIGCYP